MAALSEIRRAVEKELGDGEVITVDSSTTSSITSNIFKNATSGASHERYNGAFFFFPSGVVAGQQRRGRPGGLDPAAGTVLFYPDLGAVPGVVPVEITRLFPCDGPPAEGPTYRSLINASLKKLAHESIVTLPSTVSRSYDLGLTYSAWLDNPKRLVLVSDPPRYPGALTLPTWRQWELRRNGLGTFFRWLDAPMTSATSYVELTFVKPAFYHVNGAESTVGLVAETDSVGLPIDHVVTATLAEAYMVMSQQNASAPVDPDAQKKYEYWAEQTQNLVSYDPFRERPQPAATPQAAAAGAG